MKGKKGKRRLLNGRTRSETSRRVATFVLPPRPPPFFPPPSFSSSSFERFVFMWTRPSAAATRPEGSAAAVSESARKAKEGREAAFLGGFGAERCGAEDSVVEAQAKPPFVGSKWAQPSPCVRPAGGAGGGRCPRPVFFSTTPPRPPPSSSWGFSFLPLSFTPVSSFGF